MPVLGKAYYDPRMKLTATEPPRTKQSTREKKREFLFWLSLCFGMGATTLYQYIETHLEGIPDERILWHWALYRNWAKYCVSS